MLTDTKFLEIYHRQQESGLSIQEFCANEGLKEPTFYYWRKKLSEQGRIKGFIPLVVKPDTSLVTNMHKDNLGENGLSGTEDDCLLELVYPNGTLLRIKNDINLNRLRTLINLCD